MVVLDGNCAVGCGSGMDYPYVRIFQRMLEQTDAITNEVLEPITFVLTYPTIFNVTLMIITLLDYTYCVNTLFQSRF